jgi:hypothetical protein
MDGMNVNGKPKRAPKQKVYTVDTRKPRAAAELSVLTPANGFEEIVSSKPLRKAPVHRYFRFLPNLIGGVPGGMPSLEAAFQAAAAAVAVPAPPPPQPAGAAPQLPPSPAGSQGSYGAMHEDEDVDDLANVLAEQGVGSQGEFDELVALMEQKAVMEGGRRRRRSTRRTRKSRKSRRRQRKN